MINLESAIDSSQTTIVLNRTFTTSEFPVAGVILIGTEEIHYTNIAGDRFIGCTRGYHSTVAAAHAKNSAVTLVVTDITVTPITSLSTSQRDRVVTPTVGMFIYNTTINKLNVYTGAAWEVITSA